MENEKAGASLAEAPGPIGTQEDYTRGFLQIVARFFDL
jgi:hypothetical protein